MICDCIGSAVLVFCATTNVSTRRRVLQDDSLYDGKGRVKPMLQTLQTYSCSTRKNDDEFPVFSLFTLATLATSPPALKGVLCGRSLQRVMRHKAMQRTQSHGPVVMLGLCVMLSLLKLGASASIESYQTELQMRNPLCTSNMDVCKICRQLALGNSWQDSHFAKTGVRK